MFPVAVLQLLMDQGNITSEEYEFFYKHFEEISKILAGLINSLK
ncbi:hypothetical protein ACFL4D_01565 [Candidatus Margulisiibacteriota bacterium]